MYATMFVQRHSCLDLAFFRLTLPRCYFGALPQRYRGWVLAREDINSTAFAFQATGSRRYIIDRRK